MEQRGQSGEQQTVANVTHRASGKTARSKLEAEGSGMSILLLTTAPQRRGNGVRKLERMKTLGGEEERGKIMSCGGHHKW